MRTLAGCCTGAASRTRPRARPARLAARTVVASVRGCRASLGSRAFADEVRPSAFVRAARLAAEYEERTWTGIRCAVRSVRGSRDVFAGEADAAAFVALIPDFSEVRLADAGHFANVERPDAVLAAIAATAVARRSVTRRRRAVSSPIGRFDRRIAAVRRTSPEARRRYGRRDTVTMRGASASSSVDTRERSPHIVSAPRPPSSRSSSISHQLVAQPVDHAAAPLDDDDRAVHVDVEVVELEG